MTILLLYLAVIIVALAWRASRMPLQHRWRRRQARVMSEALRGRDRMQPPALIYAWLREMDALAFEELLLESFERRGHRVICNRRYTGDGGIDGQVVIDGRAWLIKAKSHVSAIRPEHVRAFAALCPSQAALRLFIHTWCTCSASREVIASWRGRDCLWIAPFVARHRRFLRHRRGACAVIPKFPLIYAALAAAMIIPSIAQARGKGTAAEERLITGCIHRSARGKPWLEKTLSALSDQEGGWIGAKVRNEDGSHDLGPMQINSWWIPRFARLLGRSPLQIAQ